MTDPPRRPRRGDHPDEAAYIRACVAYGHACNARAAALRAQADTYRVADPLKVRQRRRDAIADVLDGQATALDAEAAR